MSEQEKPNRKSGSGDTPGSQGEGGDLARGDPEAREEFQGRSGGGDSAGGAYARPEADDGKSSGFMGHGGQSEMSYRGKGRLGDREVGGNENAPAEEES